MTLSRRVGAFAALIVLGAIAWIIPGQVAAWGAGALLYPIRQHVAASVPDTCASVEFLSAGTRLRGWRCGSDADRRGTIIFLHGVGDTRASSVGVIRRYVPRGFDVIAYDSRAHGESEGDVCTYGFFEKDDLRRVLDALQDPGPIVLIGSSLGAAVAHQEAADDPRVRVVVAAETFSDLRTVAAERAPFVMTNGMIQRAFLLAEQRGRFPVDDVSPQAAARRITVPVLVIHGGGDHETPPDHSRRVFEAVQSKKRLIIVPDAGHSRSLDGDVWNDVDRWIDDALK